MNRDSRVTLRWPILIVAVIALLAAGAGVTFLLMRRSVDAVSRRPDATASSAAQSQPSPGGKTASSASNVPSSEVVVTLSEDAVKRAGIELASVTVGGGSSSVRIPGTVEPNAYKQVVVTPLVAGRVTRVLVELGTVVRPGQTLAQVFSPDLADAQ